jgi:pimeloyl-ACP methyl ester carboxylesterase
MIRRVATRGRTRVRSAALACVVVLTGVTAAACGNDDPAGPPQPAALSGMQLPGDFSGSGPGTLLSANTLPTVDRRLNVLSAVAARITYTSTSGIDQSLTTVSGTVFAPKGTPPDGGWPVLAFGHPTSGTETDCAPSLSPDLLTSSVIVTGLVKAGYVVAVPDYQGLGLNNTYHPYLDSTTEGYNLIDSVRAARKLIPNTSDRWLAIGISQGGQAAWAANELSDTYGSGLKLLGSASMSPAADIVGFADAAASGDLTKDQQQLLVLVLNAFKNEHADFNLDDYRNGIVVQNWDTLLACQGPATAQRGGVTDQLTAEDLRPVSPAAVDTLRGYLQNASLPKVRAPQPMLVIYGGQDQLVPAPWTAAALQRACGLGDVIEIRFQPDSGHDVDASGAFPWITDRFKGVPAINSCAPPPPPPPPAADGGN